MLYYLFKDVNMKQLMSCKQSSLNNLYCECNQRASGTSRVPWFKPSGGLKGILDKITFCYLCQIISPSTFYQYDLCIC